MAENKKNTLPLLGAGALVLLALSSKNKKKSTTNNALQNHNTGSDEFLNELPDNFSGDNGVVSPIASEVVPFIVPSSFVIEVVKNKFYYMDYSNSDAPQKIYLNGAKVSFLLCIHVPNTAIGSLQIEDVELSDLQLVRYISDQQQEWINPLGSVLYKSQLQAIAKKMKGLIVSSGYNIFDIEFMFSVWDLSNKAKQNTYPMADYEAVSMGLNIKYSETRLAHWRLLSAWNIKEDELINTGDSLGTNTRFGVTRNYESKPRADRGLFSEWWSEYLANGYNTNITKISVTPNTYQVS